VENYGKPHSGKPVSRPVEIRTKYLLNTSIKLLRYTDTLSLVLTNNRIEEKVVLYEIYA
jgi:hypothetical protein